jgi:hypothetical protein
MIISVNVIGLWEPGDAADVTIATSTLGTGGNGIRLLRWGRNLATLAGPPWMPRVKVALHVGEAAGHGEHQPSGC